MYYNLGSEGLPTVTRSRVQWLGGFLRDKLTCGERHYWWTVLLGCRRVVRLMVC